MPLVASEIKAKFRSRIHSGLKRVFLESASMGTNYPPVSDEFWEKLSDAISDIAMDLVEEIQTKAEVVPGIQVMTTDSAGDSGTGATISPGKIQ